MNESHQAIEETVEDLIATWNIHNAETFSVFFPPDAGFTDIKSQLIRGRERIVQQHAPPFTRPFRNVGWT